MGVSHRKLKERLVGSQEWVEFAGTCRAWELLDGKANVEEHWLEDPIGAYKAAAFRRTDPSTGSWSIWWFDPRVSRVEPPVEGTFVDGVGTFCADDRLCGKTIRVRFLWHSITSDSASWEQAFSADGGETWEENRIMRFERQK
jgi:hypothetical protein